MKAGKIKFVPPSDRVEDSAKLRIELLNGDSTLSGDVEIVADTLLNDEQRKAVALFSYNVENSISSSTTFRDSMSEKMTISWML